MAAAAAGRIGRRRGIGAVPRGAVPLAGGEEGGSNDGKGEGKDVDSDMGGSDMEEDGEEEGAGEYLGHAGVPPGSCFRPHPYFRPAVPPGGGREGSAHGGDEGREGVLPLPLPLINLGFPKAGTNTLEMFFRCGMEGDEERDDGGGGGGGKRRRRRREMAGGLNISHMTCLSRPDSDFCGRCMHGAVAAAAAAGGGGGGHHGPPGRVRELRPVHPDRSHPGGNGTRPCHWPQVDLLDEIHAESPEATFLLTMRDFDAWYGSMAGWNGYDQRLGRCRLGAYPGGIHDPQGGGEERRRRAEGVPSVPSTAIRLSG